METDAGRGSSAPAHYLPLCSPGEEACRRFDANLERERERERARGREGGYRGDRSGQVCVYTDWNRPEFLPCLFLVAKSLANFSLDETGP